MTVLGLDYEDAHSLVTWTIEQLVVTEIMRLNFTGYQRAFDPYVRADEHENLVDVAPDLFMDPYEGASSELRAAIRRAQLPTGGLDRRPPSYRNRYPAGPDAAPLQGVGDLPFALAAEPETLYVSRPLLNADELAAWAKSAGFSTTVPPEEMHVTVACSRRPVSWTNLMPQTDEVWAAAGGRSLKALGEAGDAVALRFACPQIEARWQELVDAGCSWDWPEFKPHVTITFQSEGVDLASVAPFEGELRFGPETFEPIDETWKDDLTEKSDTVSEATGLAWHDQSSAVREENDVPWKTTADLPAGVRGSLPDAAQTVFRTVANRVKSSGGTDASAMAQAWTAVKNGWEKKDGGWVRKPADKLAKSWSDEAREAASEARRASQLQKTHEQLAEKHSQYAQLAKKDGDPDTAAKHEEAAASHAIAAAQYKDAAGLYGANSGAGADAGALRTASLSAGLADNLRSGAIDDTKRLITTKFVVDFDLAKGAAAVPQDTAFFMPIQKKEPQADGSVVVVGYASTPTRDLDGEIISLDAVKKALPSYMEWRNIREMHQPSAVGTAKEAHVDDRGLFLRARVVAPAAVQLVNEGVYQGFSVGGRKLAKKGDTITDIELVEISLVDRPCNGDCRFAVAKVAGGAATMVKGFDLVRVVDERGLFAGSIELLPAERSFLGGLMKKLGFGTAAQDPADLPKFDDIMKREFSDKKRKELEEKGHAMPGGGYPIENAEDVGNAVQAFGRAKDPAATKRHIVRQAKRVGATHLLPEDWPGSTKGEEKVAKAWSDEARATAAEARSGTQPHKSEAGYPQWKAGDQVKDKFGREGTVASHDGGAVDAYHPSNLYYKSAVIAKGRADFYTVSNLISLLGQLEWAEECCEGEGGCCPAPGGAGTSVDPGKEFTNKFGAILVQFGDMVAELLDRMLASMKDEERQEAAAKIAGAVREVVVVPATWTDDQVDAFQKKFSSIAGKPLAFEVDSVVGEGGALARLAAVAEEEAPAGPRPGADDTFAELKSLFAA